MIRVELSRIELYRIENAYFTINLEIKSDCMTLPSFLIRSRFASRSVLVKTYRWSSRDTLPRFASLLHLGYYLWCFANFHHFRSLRKSSNISILDKSLNFSVLHNLTLHSNPLETLKKTFRKKVSQCRKK